MKDFSWRADCGDYECVYPADFVVFSVLVAFFTAFFATGIFFKVLVG